MEISSKSIRLTGCFEVPVELEIKDYKVKALGSITSVKIKDENDGTYSKEYKFKPLLGEVVSEAGETIPLKDKMRNSQKLRRMIAAYGMENHSNIEPEDFYNMVHAFYRKNFDRFMFAFEKERP